MKITRTLLRQISSIFLLMIGALALQLAMPALAQSSGVIDPTDCPALLNAMNGCQGGFRGIVLLIMNFFLGFLGLLTLLMVIYGGFLYVSSGGNDESVGKAKKILLYAVIGIIIIIIAFPLVNTLLGAGTGERAA